MIDGFQKVLILGGSGFVGRHLCEHLADHRWRITVPTRRLRNAQHLCIQPKVTLLEANIHHPAELQRLVAGHDAVVNLVAILHGSAADFERAHVTLPTQLAKACHAQGVRRLVHISALGADAQHPDTLPSMYLRSKSRGEAALLAASKVLTSPSNQSAMQLTMLRPSVLFGAGDRFLNVFASLQRLFPLVPLAGAQARFQPAWVEDLAQAIVYCLNYPHHTAGKTFEVCGPEVLTLKQLVQGAGQWAGIANGQGRPVVGLPMWMGRIQAALMQLAPGEPLMSADNLDSMRVDNVATGRLPGLKDLCITPSSVRSIAPLYLSTTSQLDILRGR